MNVGLVLLIALGAVICAIVGLLGNHALQGNLAFGLAAVVMVSAASGAFADRSQA